MNDPHVVSLRYQLETGDTIRFNDPPPLVWETSQFRAILDTGVLTAALKGHYATEGEARAVVEPSLRAWEIDLGLQYGPGAVAFAFEKAEVIDRDPPGPGEARAHREKVTLAFGVAFKFTVRYSPARYPDPPTHFTATPDVQSLWLRYRMYHEGKEPLLSMAYFCLTLLEGTTGLKHGAREAVCKMYGIDRAVRDKLGDLVSQKGSPAEARKFDAEATLVPLTGKEKKWVDEVVRALIRRKAEYDFDPSASLPLLTMADFIAL
jgi:hypothetical protein